MICCSSKSKSDITLMVLLKPIEMARQLQSLVDHFAANRENHILKTEIIKTFMLDHYFVIGIRTVNAWCILLRSEKIIETQLMKKYSKADFLLCLATIDWMQIFSDLSFDPNLMTDACHEIFESALNSPCCYWKEKSATRKTLWLNPTIKAKSYHKYSIKQSTWY